MVVHGETNIFCGGPRYKKFENHCATACTAQPICHNGGINSNKCNIKIYITCIHLQLFSYNIKITPCSFYPIIVTTRSVAYLTVENLLPPMLFRYTRQY